MILLYVLVTLYSGSALAQSQVKFYYYSSPTTAVVQLEAIGIAAANIDNTRPLKIICHGADANINVDWYTPMISAYLNKGYQAIAVDWGELASSAEVVSSINLVGNLIGTYIIAIQETFEFPLENIHFIGHSLGAHIGGYAGRLVRQVVGTNFARITGLDPGTDLTLNIFGRTVMTPSDADFVDVIHTMAGTGGIGYSVGTADFYPNGGALQPNCLNILNLVCSHTRAPWLFIESINSSGFLSRRCDSWLNYALGLCNGNSVALMGDRCSTSASGDYYLSTNGNPPYAQG
ncbi:phospholipase A1 VesT1.02-like [Onthophagus taurus]|uniref:phospholipase A1 VesT1.02-like n=1 Tax=Onthophagus taurus TaxID=166361 RepID=UPI000C1FDE6C|nr:phospholipase A1-like [Onthophagus taurus]XP_022917557.1 phospholipase A1-like [Onthophagus taurus]